MKKAQVNTEKENDTSVYMIFSVAILMFFIAALTFLLMYTAGYNFGFEAPATNIQTADTTAAAAVTEPAIPETAEPVTQAPETETSVTSEPAETEYDAYLSEDTEVLMTFLPSALEELYPDTVLASTDDMGREYLDRITFLGDSTTYGLIRYSMLRDGRSTKQVWTPLSGTLTLSQASIAKIYYPDEDTELTIAEAVEKKPPDIFVITLGVNGISFMKQDYFVGEYEKLINSVQETSPDTKIILQSILPVARSYPNQDQINNDKISEANGWIAELAQKCGVKYLDTYSALVGEDGFMPEEYQNGDGLHLNEISFNIELDYIRTHAIVTDDENTLIE